jgi:hypothetical protein
MLEAKLENQKLKAQNRALKEKSEVLERINAEQKAEVSHK